MDKLKMAHEYAIALINSDCEMQFDKFIRLCWNYADAMQAEADKREPSGFPNVLRGACGEIVAVKVDDKEWQPDWSQAPYWANWWAMDEDRKCHWFSKEPWSHNGASEWVLENNGEGLNNIYSPSIHCGYIGDWRNSLRKRPK